MLGKSRVLNEVGRRRFVSDVPVEDVLAYRAAGETPEEAQIRTDREKALREAMAKLPADMQTALYLSYFEDMTYEEIARVMKISKKQVDNLLYRGKERLRDLLEEWK
jgi:RNA polymerase sigma-70 factor (ECF subfamily)